MLTKIITPIWWIVIWTDRLNFVLCIRNEVCTKTYKSAHSVVWSYEFMFTSMALYFVFHILGLN